MILHAREDLGEVFERVLRVDRDAMDQELFGTDKHLAMRRVRSQPVLDQLPDWIDQQRPKHLPEGPMGAALRYISNQSKPLTVFMNDSKSPVTKTPASPHYGSSHWQEMTPLLRRRAGGSQLFRPVHSLVQTAERYGVNALAYLEDVLTRVQSHPASRIDDLLPDRWKPC